MVSRQQTITAYQNRHTGQQEYGRSALNDVQQQRDTSPTDMHDHDMSARRHRASHAHQVLTGGETGSLRRSTVLSRADTIATYRNRRSGQLQSEGDASNDVPNAQQDQTSPLPPEDVNTMLAPNQWPSHARICRTRPEDDGKMFGRGVLKGLKAAKKHFDNGTEKLPIQFSTRLGGTIGINYRSFVDDVVIFMKKHAPIIGVKKWSDIDKSVKRDIVVDTLELWDLEDTPKTAQKFLDIANERYRGWRSTLHSTYKCYRTDAECRRNKPEDVGAEEWDYLIEYFGTDTQFQKLSKINSENRKKQKTKHLMGSKSYSELSYEKRDLETGQEPDDIELWEISHLKNGVWSNNESQAVHEDACAQVTEKEREEGGPISKEEKNTIFQNSCRASLGCRTSQTHGHGYMAKPPSVSERLRTQMDEHARVTSETQRQNEELNYHVQNLEDRNEVLNLHVQDLEEQNKDLNAQLQSLGNKNDELNLQVKNLESQLATDRAERAKEMEDLKRSMTDEMLKLVRNQPATTQPPSQQKKSERSSNGNNGKRPVLQDQSFSQIPGAVSSVLIILGKQLTHIVVLELIRMRLYDCVEHTSALEQGLSALH